MLAYDCRRQVKADGLYLKKVASTHGGEFAGPCPSCGGEDRFRVWPEQGRYWCRGCARSGDAIQYLWDFKGIAYMEACFALGQEPKATTGRLKLKPVWAPKDAGIPNPSWHEKASAFLVWTQEQLWTDEGGEARAFLHNRGIQDATIKKAGLGWNPTDAYRDREAWGLEPEIKENGRPKGLWLPKGLVIPCRINEKPIRIRIRRPKPENRPRYYALPGSTFPPMSIGAGLVAVVVESELDAILTAQEAPQDVYSLAMGSVQAKPDLKAHNTLQQTKRILVALDADTAGAKASRWWLNQYPQAIRWPVPIKKDPGDAFTAGLCLKAWIESTNMEF
ncbi:P4 alpha zinc-binding domain protein [Desulfatibacillum aliphaticivorans]|uniref:P4 alpha zinc-binding domain protein n=1 Tax=Desulfatibacillum aliphaticivorans TaxID=218208 RepID=B8F8U4_DESAL|nr:P4 alpha zinc-binding domain protein [Desulfatibacillum aliphaticivorans]